MTDTTAGEGVREIIETLEALTKSPGTDEFDRGARAARLDALDMLRPLAAQPSAGAQDEREAYLRGSLDVVLRAVLDMARVGIEVAKQGEGYDTEERDRARIDFIREVCERWKATPAQPDTGAVAALREAFLCLLTNSAGSGVRFDYDGDADDEGRMIVTCDVTIKVDHGDLQEFCDALGMTGPLTEGLEDRLNRYIETDADLSTANTPEAENPNGCIVVVSEDHGPDIAAHRYSNAPHTRRWGGVMIQRTKLHPSLCWVVGLSHVAHAAVILLTLGFFYTSLPLKAATWACRTDQKWNAQ